MIYSSDHNFLLIKNKKVGGTSLEVDLSQILPENAIVTPIYPINNNHKPRNYSGFYNHISYSEIQNKIDLSNVLSYVFVRHPYSMVLSDMFHGIGGASRWNILSDKDKDILVDKYFDENDSNYYEDMPNKMLNSTKNLFTSDNDIQVTKILKYEDGIENQINSILPNHSLPKIKLLSKEKTYRPENINHSDIFKKRHYEKINKEWFWEFENLGYNI